MRFITLEQWVKDGNNMLSNYTTRWACVTLNISEKQLRALSLDEIFSIPMVGEVAKREILRFLKNNS